MKKGLLITGITVLLAGVAAASLQLYANHLVRKHVEEYAGTLEPNLSLEADKCRYNLLRRSAHIEGIVLRSNMAPTEEFDTISVDEVIIYSYDTENPTPHYAHMEMRGMAIPVSLTEEVLAEAEQIGFARRELTDLKIDAQSIYRFDPATKQFVGHKNDLQLRGLAGIKSRFHLANIDLAFFGQQDPRQMNPFVMIAALGNIQLVSMELDLEIGDLTSRVFEGMARRNSIPVEDLKEQFSDLVSASLQNSPEVSAEMTEIIQDFIKDPGDMRFTFSPERPVSVMEVFELSQQGGELLAETLNLKVEKL